MVTRVVMVAAWLATASSAVSQQAPGPSLLDGTWMLELAEPGPGATAPGRSLTAFRTSLIQTVNLTVGPQTTHAERDAEIIALTHLFSPMHYLSIEVTSSGVTVLDDIGRNEYVSKRTEAHSLAGVRVKVTSAWRDASVVLEVAGDHGLKVEEVVRPSSDGSQLTVTWTLLSPKAQAPLTITQSYRRLSAIPPAPNRPIAGDPSTQIEQDPGGQESVVQSPVLTLYRDRPTEVLLAARPMSVVGLTLLSVTLGTAETIDFTAPNATVQLNQGAGGRQAQAPNIDLPIGNATGSPVSPLSGSSHPRGVTLVLTGGTSGKPSACFLPIRFDTESLVDAGEVTFNAGRGFSSDGTTNCESAANGFRVRLAYVRALPIK
jgi:hypothetical protein